MTTTIFCIVHGREHDLGDDEDLYLDPCRIEEWTNVVDGEVLSSTVEVLGRTNPAGPAVMYGTPAYVVTVDGLVPVRIDSVDEDGAAHVQVTGRSRPGWKRGSHHTIGNPRVSLALREQVSLHRTTECQPVPVSRYIIDTSRPFNVRTDSGRWV